jgi:hypothetical protein
MARPEKERVLFKTDSTDKIEIKIFTKSLSSRRNGAPPSDLNHLDTE